MTDCLSYFNVYFLFLIFASGQGTGVGGLAAAECMTIPMGNTTTSSLTPLDRVREREHEKERDHELAPRGGADRVILTDLEEVVPLLEANVARWKSENDHDRDRRAGRGGGVQGGGGSDVEFEVPEVKVRALPWEDRRAARLMLDESMENGGTGTGITHILCSDLVRPSSVFKRWLANWWNRADPDSPAAEEPLPEF